METLDMLRMAERMTCVKALCDRCDAGMMPVNIIDDLEGRGTVSWWTHDGSNEGRCPATPIWNLGITDAMDARLEEAMLLGAVLVQTGQLFIGEDGTTLVRTPSDSGVLMKAYPSIREAVSALAAEARKSWQK